MTTVGEKIAQARKDKGLTQQDIADKMGLKKNTYAHKEKHSTFSKLELDQVLDILGLSEANLTTNRPEVGVDNRLIASLERENKLLQDVVKELKEKVFQRMEEVAATNLKETQEMLRQLEKNQALTYAFLEVVLEEVIAGRVKTEKQAIEISEGAHKRFVEKAAKIH